MGKDELSTEFQAYVIDRAQECEHKDGVKPEDWNKVNPKLLIVADFVINHCDRYNLPLKFTSIIRPKIKESKTDIHADGRAFDISVIGWTSSDVRDCVLQVNRTLNIGALSLKDGLEREAVYEDGKTAGNAPHIHFQVRP